MSEIKLEETPTLTFEPFKEESQLPVEEPQKQMAAILQIFRKPEIHILAIA